jgi:hypothetical protein
MVRFDFSIAGGFSLFQSREIKKWKAGRPLDLECALTGKKHHGRMRVDAVHPNAAMSRCVSQIGKYASWVS